jgi:adenylate cyclase
LFPDFDGTVRRAPLVIRHKHLLNSYFTLITKPIFDCNGTIDKYVGDMVMAFWGAPLDDSNHRNNAVLAAINMQKITSALKVEFAEKGCQKSILV